MYTYAPWWASNTIQYANKRRRRDATSICTITILALRVLILYDAEDQWYSSSHKGGNRFARTSRDLGTPFVYGSHRHSLTRNPFYSTFVRLYIYTLDAFPFQPLGEPKSADRLTRLF